MEEQADKFREQKRNNQLLLVASARGYFADVEALLERGAQLDCKDKAGLGPLHFAAGRGRLAMAQYLWSKAAEVDAEGPDGRTPLHLAAAAGHTPVVTFLLQKGAWAEAFDSQDVLPLHLAARNGHLEVIEALVRHSAKPGCAKTKQGLTAVGEALVHGHTEAAAALLSWGAGLDDRTQGFSLLHLVAGVGKDQSVQFLLQRGADVNEHSNAEGATPLHSAVLGSEPRCVALLAAAGADPNILDAGGRRPADLPQAAEPAMQGALGAAAAASITPGDSASAAAAGAAHCKQAAALAAAAAPKSLQDAFRSLSESEQLSKVERWSAMEPADLAAALQHYPEDAAEEVAARMKQMQAARRLLNINKALAAMHEDEEFQSDASQPRVRAAIDALRKDPSQYERYASDPQILAVLQKMRRMHAVSQANGQRTISLEDMVVEAGSDWAARDRERQAALQAGTLAEQAAAAAAAAADPGAASAAAATAFDVALHAAKLAARARSHSSARIKSPSAGEGPQPLQAAARGRESGPGREGGSAVRDPGPSSSVTAGDVIGEADDDDKLPEWMRGGFSWKKVWREFLQQSLQSLAFLLVFLLLAWIVRGRPPWESAVAQAKYGSGPPAAGGSAHQDL